MPRTIKEWECSVLYQYFTHHLHLHPLQSLWNLISTPAMQGLAITMICSHKVTSSRLLQQPFQILKLPSVCSVTSRHFHLPPHYEDHTAMMHISLDIANLNAINISTPDFAYVNISIATGWQATYRNWQTHLKFPSHNSTNKWSAQSEPVLPFELNSNKDEEPSLTWKLLAYPRDLHMDYWYDISHMHMHLLL